MHTVMNIEPADTDGLDLGPTATAVEWDVFANYRQPTPHLPPSKASRHRLEAV